jgi:anti-anti-sigma regulatory factor
MEELIVQAPAFLGTNSRGAFYEEALDRLTSLSTPASEGGGRLIVDLGKTTGIDSMGLSTLVLLQLRAAERRLTVTLRSASEEVRFLLLMTRLEDRFDIESQS